MVVIEIVDFDLNLCVFVDGFFEILGIGLMILEVVEVFGGKVSEVIV